MLACPACGECKGAQPRCPLCPACTRAARDLAPCPLWVFDSPLLRRALAQLNLAAVPAIIRAASALPQKDLAMLTGHSPAALSSYERGQRAGLSDIRTLLQFADATAMPRAALLPLLTGIGDRPAEHSGGKAADADYLCACPAEATAAGAAFVPGPATRPVTASHIRYWQACIGALHGHVQTMSPAALLRPALGIWHHVLPALTPPPGGQAGRQLPGTAAELALCAALAALDAGCRPLARSLFTRARDLARDAGDTLSAVPRLTSLAALADIELFDPGHAPVLGGRIHPAIRPR